MKKIILLLLMSCVIYFVPQAQEVKEKKVQTSIQSATVYLTGAEIIRTKKLNLTAGKTKLIFEGLSPKISQKSIRITIDNDVDLLGISRKINYLTKEKDLPNIKKLKDSLKMNNEKLQSYTDEVDAYSTEKKMLLSNTSIGGEQNGVSIADLKQASDFYRSRIRGGTVHEKRLSL
jgi:hypothetical protein